MTSRFVPVTDEQIFVLKPGFHMVVTVERVVTVVRVVFATKWKHEEKSYRDTLATVHDSYNSVIEIDSSSIPTSATTVATG